MINASPALIALLNSGRQFYMADLLTLTLIGGTVLRHTNFDVDVTVGADTWSHDGLLFKRGPTKISRGITVDTNEITLIPRDGYQVGGVPFLGACKNGALDGAKARIDRAYMAAPGDTSAGALWRFSGWIAEMEVSGIAATCTARPATERLNQKWPRNLFQPACRHTLFDAGCGLNKAAFQVSSAAASGSSKSTINCALAQAAGYFDLGVIAFTSGVNSGARRMVKSYTPGVLQLSFPLLATPGVGDTFNAWPGCDKTRDTCTNKFNNVARWLAFPYVPVPETAV